MDKSSLTVSVLVDSLRITVTAHGIDVFVAVRKAVTLDEVMRAIKARGLANYVEENAGGHATRIDATVDLDMMQNISEFIRDILLVAAHEDNSAEFHTISSESRNTSVEVGIK